jgi:hypothetical protein
MTQGQPEQQRRQIIESLSEKLDAISITADALLEKAKPKIRAIESPKQKMPQLEPVAVRAEPKLAVAKAEAKPVVVRTESQQPKAVTTDAKLSDYYGVNQVNDAVAFVTLYPRAESVQIAGDFNGWQPTKLPMEKVGANGVWQASAKLSPGKYRYRLVVDGQWQQDPYNEITELNPFGGYNSIVEVK